MSFRVSRQRKLRIDLALIKITCNLKLKLTCNRTRPKLKGGGGHINKTRQDKTMFYLESYTVLRISTLSK